MNEAKLTLLVKALKNMEGIESPAELQANYILTDKLESELAKVKAGYRKFYVWYADSSEGNFFSISGIVWVKSHSCIDAVRRLCGLRGVEFFPHADYAGLDLTEGTLLAENEQEAK